ncbi:hypothetical protein PVAP13_8KG252600 [Panicum virgatum]|uniref:Uncharacterized protein n=1 Tax=Panicum virgatum TaxID=38727 RepID=A0A8T0PTG9_PANVG|nr:hypothetical protein PVAP13_8KG252600 [Panicum virgatum]
MASEMDDGSMPGGECMASRAPPPFPAPAKGRLEGKVALITGGASGLGKAAAHEFIQEGTAAVVITDVNTKLGLAAGQELGPRAHFVPCDVTVEDSVAAAVDAAVAWHGRLDVMLNSAGVAGSLAGTSRHATHVMAAPAGSTAASGGGSIICMASVSGVLGGLGTYPYSVSKFPVAGVVKAAAAELSRLGVRVNCNSPFAVPMPMVVEQFATMLEGATAGSIIRGLSELRGTTCEVVDVARAAVYLASDDAKYVSGHNLVVDGGFTSYKRMNLPFPTKLRE